MNDGGKRVAKAAAFLIVTTIFARILGLARESILYSIFNANYMTDAYRAAFSIPDYVYMMLVGGALSSAFIPVFSSYIATDREDEGWLAASIVFNYIILFLFILITIAYIYTEWLIKRLVPGLPIQSVSLAVTMTHIMFLQTFFMVLNGIAMGILNCYNHFVTPAIGSLIYNVTIIIVGVAFYRQYGIVAFSYGVVAGAALDFIIQIPDLRKVGIRYHFSWNYSNPGFVQIISLMLPVMIGLGVVQLNPFVTQNLASNLGPGMISALDLAQKIMNLPIGIFATPIAIAVFPTLTVLIAKGEKNAFLRTNSLSLRAILLVSIPSSLGIMAIGEPLIEVLFKYGNFTSTMAHIVYQALLYFCIGIFAYSAVQILNRSFYALKDTLTPIMASILTIGFNIILSIHMVEIWGIRGLALASSCSAIFNLLFLLIMLRIKAGPIGIRKIILSASISLTASLLMFLVVHYSTYFLIANMHLTIKLNQLLSLAIGIILGALVYMLLIYCFKLQESELLLGLIHNRFSNIQKTRIH